MDCNCNTFMAELHIIIISFMRKVKCKPGLRNPLPWLNEKLRSLVKQRDQALKMTLKNKAENER